MKNKKLFAILTLVCFMFTLMPVAAFAADPQQSYIYVEDESVEVGDTVTLTLDMDAAATTLYVWFEEVGYDNVVVNAVNELNNASNSGLMQFANVAADAELDVVFGRDGEFVVHAAIADPTGTDPKFDAQYELRALAAEKTVVVAPADSDSDKYELINVGITGGTASVDVNTIEDGKSAVVSGVVADGAAVYEMTMKLVDEFGANVSALDVEIDTTSGVDVTNIELKRSGLITFDLTAEKAGNHKVYVTIEDYKATIKVNAADAKADSIELVAAPLTPVNIDDVKTAGNLASRVEFAIYDANGSELGGAAAGVEGAKGSDTTGEKRNYVALTEKPAGSDKASKDFALMYAGPDYGWTIKHNGFDEEGTYSFKVVLDNGEYATASMKVMESGDYVAMNISYDADSVQLGATIQPKAIVWLDANRVSTSIFKQGAWVEDVDFAVTGAAVESVDEDSATITIKDDEKYVGSEITVTVVDEENNLVATKVLTVAAEAKELVFDTTAVAVDANKTVGVKLVDETGKSVALTGVTTTEAYVIVLDKPVDAEVDVDSKTYANNKGQFTFGFSCDTVGTVKLQAVLKATQDGVVRYYTGVGEIKVGATGIEDTVVMSIGANKIVVNDEVVAIDAAPMIKDSRTFVPFRALAEAFGAVVAYDEATQAVTAELDGTKVVMTIGSEVYTVNGVAKTADVAPFISDSRTMVPVRFAAEAFGITVTPIYAEDGSVADVLFTK